MGFLIKSDVAKGLSDYKKALGMAQALINNSWLLQFKVYNKLRLKEFTEAKATTAAEEENAWAWCLPPG